MHHPGAPDAKCISSFRRSVLEQWGLGRLDVSRKGPAACVGLKEMFSRAAPDDGRG